MVVSMGVKAREKKAEGGKWGRVAVVVVEVVVVVVVRVKKRIAAGGKSEKDQAP